MATQNPAKPIKILMLHGYTQTGPLFRSKTRALEKNLAKAFPGGVILTYPTAPIRLSRAQIPSWDTGGGSAQADDEPEAYGWWTRKDKVVSSDGTSIEADGFVYEGLEAGLAAVARVLQDEGPFDGVVGFSQGAAAAAMIASLLEPGREEAFQKAAGQGGMSFPRAFDAHTHPPLKFAVSYSGFAPAQNPLYNAFYNPKIKTPMLHFLGSVDTVVEEKRSLRLAHACEEYQGRVIYHPGGHFLPSSQKQYVSILVAFIRHLVAAPEGRRNVVESAGHVDVPLQTE